MQRKYAKLKKKYRLIRSIPPGTTDRYMYEATVFAHAYDFTPDELRASLAAGSQAPHGPYRTALWFLPYFETPFYGGMHTILRFADFLQRRYGIRSSFAIVGMKDTSPISASIQKAFPGLAGNPVYPLPNIYRFDGLPDHDLGICTLWTTAYSLLKFNRVRRKLYFMQDYEPYFYPSGSTSSQVMATYRFGFDGICNTPALLASYEEHGGRGRPLLRR
ncbi:hypothetical protein N6H14_19070 [Paenibacillus sp. CC-CFT747]|nr:hypothetical protein N6H14_19070 [Paenibacillus sp. CC-CFT747]